MYTAANLSPAAIKALSELQSQGANFSVAFEAALGYVAASRLPLSSMASDDVVSQYRMSFSLPVNTALSNLNEMLPIRIRVIDGLVQSFFRFRVASMFPAEVPLAINPETSLVDFFSLSSHFSKDVLETIAEEGDKVTNLIVRLRPVWDDLCKMSSGDDTVSYDNGTGDVYPN